MTLAQYYYRSERWTAAHRAGNDLQILKISDQGTGLAKCSVTGSWCDHMRACVCVCLLTLRTRAVKRAGVPVDLPWSESQKCVRQPIAATIRDLHGKHRQKHCLRLMFSHLASRAVFEMRARGAFR
jgi:hypothetical protein